MAIACFVSQADIIITNQAITKMFWLFACESTLNRSPAFLSNIYGIMDSDYDTVRHSTMMEKFSNFPIPDNVYNCMGCQFSIWSLSPQKIQWHSLCDCFHFCKHCAGFGSRSLLLCYGGLGPTTPCRISLICCWNMRMTPTWLSLRAIPTLCRSNWMVFRDGPLIIIWLSMCQSLVKWLSEAHAPRLTCHPFPLQFLVLHVRVLWRF